MRDDIFFYLGPAAPSQEGNGRLAGKAIALQPAIAVRGWPTEAGSLSLKGYVALEDAAVVERLQGAGGRLVGFTRMSEMGLGITGDTAGSAVAGGRADLALVLDMMGEGRLAASRAGLCGFKLSAGLVSRWGLIGLIPSLETIAILARSWEQIETTLDVVVYADGRDPLLPAEISPELLRKKAAQRPIRTLGVITEIFSYLDQEEKRAFRLSIDKLKSLGLDVSEVSFPGWCDFGLVHQIVGAVEASSSCGRYDGVRYGHRATGAKNWNEMYLKSRAQSFQLLLKTFLFQGAWFQFENYVAFDRAARIRARLAQEAADLFSQVDALLLPTGRPEEGRAAASGIARLYEQSLFTLPANVLGMPALHLPDFCGAGGGDSGLQLIGPQRGDYALLALARRVVKLVL